MYYAAECQDCDICIQIVIRAVKIGDAGRKVFEDGKSNEQLYKEH